MTRATSWGPLGAWGARLHPPQVTVETAAAPPGGCVAAAAVAARFEAPLPATGCGDPRAQNFDAGARDDDGSCLYLGGRGLETATWSAMHEAYQLDDWYPQAEYETWAAPDSYCKVPEGTTRPELEECFQVGFRGAAPHTQPPPPPPPPAVGNGRARSVTARVEGGASPKYKEGPIWAWLETGDLLSSPP